ncbi:MAG: NRDE family protein [Akkermansiaceae bacterium]
MCTMTWWRDGENYGVLFNRDELKTRARAEPPEPLTTDEGIQYLSPRDPVAGGSWMLVNQHRVTVCLLNRWHESAQTNDTFESRGLLVTAMASCTNAEEVMARVKKVDHARYRPFTLVALDPGDIQAGAWNGEILTHEVVTPPLTSSSYRFPEVSESRIRTLTQLPELDSKNLQMYQQGASPATAYTVRMNRPDAQTWSRSHINVSADRIHWEYIEENADLIGNGTVHTSELAL